jgi:integrase
MPKLTKRTIDSLVAGETDILVFDDEVKGFAARVWPSGKITYLVQYRSGGRTRRVKIGRVGVLTPDSARAKAKEILGAVAKGDNPAGVIEEHRRAPTVSSVCERFLQEHVAERCKPRTRGEYRRAVDLFIKPAIGAFKIVDVTRADIAALHHKWRETPYQANRNLGVLSKMFNLAEVWGLRADGSNPCRHVRKYQERRRETFLTAPDIKRLGQVLTKVVKDGAETAHVVAAFQLLMLTGCRLSEIQTLKWDYIYGQSLNLPDSKTGARRIPLAREALAVLDNLERDPTNPYVITGEVEGHHVTDLQRPWRRIRKAAGLDHVRIHDLRHTYASNALAQGLSLPMVGKLLGHSQIQTTMRYIHLADDPVRDAARQVAGAIDKSMNSASSQKPLSSGPGGSVVKFPGALNVRDSAVR